MSQLFVEDHREYILRELRHRVHRRPHYSQRAMARDLELAPSTLTDFLKGRIALSPNRITQLAKKIGLNQEQALHWNDLISLQFTQRPETRTINQIRVRSRIEGEKNSLTLEQFKTLSQWEHLAVLELIEMNSARYSKISATAKALGCSIPEMKNVFRRLENQGLLKKEPSSDNWIVSPSTLVGNATASEAIRQFHRQMLTRALAALDEQDMESRFFTSAFVGLTAKQVQRVKESLEHLPTKIFDPYSNEKTVDKKDQLYCFSLQFFSLLSQQKPKRNPS